MSQLSSGIDKLTGKLAGAVGAKVDTKPSANEQALMDHLGDYVTRNSQYQEQLFPYLLEEMGMVPEYDGSGNITGFNKMTMEERTAGKSPDQIREITGEDMMLSQFFVSMGVNPDTGKGFASDEEMSQYATPEQMDLYKLNQEVTAYERGLLSGEIPASPALEADLADRKRVLQEDISRRGGPAAEALSTAGIQRMGTFERGADIAREESRRAMLGQAEDMRKSVYGDVMNRRTNILKGKESLEGSRVTRAGLLAGATAPQSQWAGGIKSGIDAYTASRGLEVAADTAESTSRAHLTTSLADTAFG